MYSGLIFLVKVAGDGKIQKSAELLKCYLYLRDQSL